ncbi:hypothetical protein [Nitrosomonas sp.]|uniref:hypothetical protein n=1 Tax=Nitrosomonas sp. TaxID=42353 RepID=UPI0025FDDD92|nr:hypothetical protein [Nitrosomonas sp.]
MTTADYIKQMLTMIDNLLSGMWKIDEFRSNYYDFYLEEVPDDLLSDTESEFFGGVQEKLDWVDESPDIESQNSGWLNHEQFVEWVKQQKIKFYPE